MGNWSRHPGYPGLRFPVAFCALGSGQYASRLEHPYMKPFPPRATVRPWVQVYCSPDVLSPGIKEPTPCSRPIHGPTDVDVPSE